MSALCSCYYLLLSVFFHSDQVQRLQSRLSVVEEENSSVREQLSGLISSVETVTSERDILQEERDRTEVEMNKKLEASRLLSV